MVQSFNLSPLERRKERKEGRKAGNSSSCTTSNTKTSLTLSVYPLPPRPYCTPDSHHVRKDWHNWSSLSTRITQHFNAIEDRNTVTKERPQDGGRAAMKSTRAALRITRVQDLHHQLLLRHCQRHTGVKAGNSQPSSPECSPRHKAFADFCAARLRTDLPLSYP